ncbi:UvrD-helicase domain-containing protein, partial [Candidatus Kapabacteria bacterium]|nr:UvrD-helicase domain-containing protein [Candidatus Kapabacteria bacterium]
MNLNKQQYYSVYSNKNLSLTANAGSGKTQVLTSRYLNLLTENKEIDYEPSKILAITFTKKAAAEMRSKIIKELNLKLKNEVDSQIVHKLKNLISKMGQAKIQTINSFCMDLIEEYPDKIDVMDMGSPPTKGIQNSFFIENTNDALIELANNQPEKLKLLLTMFSLDDLGDHIKKIALDSINLNYLKLIYKNDDSYIQSMVEKEIIGIFKIHFENYTQSAKKIISNYDINSATVNAKTNIDLFKKLLLDLEISFKENNYDIYNINKYISLLKIKFSGKLFTTYFKAYSDDHLNDSINVIIDITNSIALDNPINIKVGRYIFDLANKINDKYFKYKKINNYIDYDDQLIFANTLLDDELIRNKTSSQIRHIMIDEYQDTNDIQFKIINKLLLDPTIKLFIVGDLKQSIYGFRNAEIKIFNDTNNIIKSRNNINQPINEISNSKINKMELTPDELDGLVELSVSYRMNKEIATFINVISKSLFSENNPYATKDTPIIVGSNVDVPENQNNIELLVNTNPHLYYQNVVNRIKLLLNDGIEPKNICYLANNNKQLVSLSKVLIINNIKHELHAKENFYEIQEIDDIINYLNVLAGNTSNILITKLLRSYFFGLTDTDLLNLYSIDTNILNALVLSDNRIYNDIFNKITNTINVAHQLELIEVIQEMISNSSWDSITSKTKIKQEIDKNVNSFTKIIFEKLSYGIVNINEFLENIKLDNDTEDEISLSKTKINLLTIHKSKGLEFDCVILHNLNSFYRKSSKIYITRDYGISFNNKNDNKLKIKHPTNSSTYLYGIKNNTALDEEYKRLLYVALTRAKNQLILTCDLSKTKKDGSFTVLNKSFLQLILNALSVDYQSLTLDNLSNLKVINNIDILNNNIINNSNVEVDITINTDLVSVELEINNTNEEIFDLSGPIIDKISLENLTATKLNYLKNNTDIFRKRYIYGLPETDSYQFKGIHNNPNSDEEEILGTKKGVLVHAVLENIQTFFIGNKINDDIIIKNIGRVLKNEIGDSAQLKEMLLTTVYSLLNSNFIQSNIDNLKDSITEATLQLPFKDDLLTGSIDLYTKDINDNFEIWDWKTNNISSEQIEETANFYKPQLLFYAYLISFYNPKQSIFKCRLLFTKFSNDFSLTDDWVYTFN